MAEGKRLRVVIIDMQPITPAVGGGRQRLLGLYHALGENIDATYVGSYDWPGEPPRDQQLTPGLREIVIPLSDAHHKAAARLSEQVKGTTVIDTAFPDQVALSPGYLNVARKHISTADIVIFSHPWCFRPLASALRSDQLIVYDSHNVETVLKYELLGVMDGTAESLACQVAANEYALVQRATLVLACSDADTALYQKLFDADPFKFRVVPNGTFVDRFPKVDRTRRSALRERLGLPVQQLAAIFLGSAYGPNTDAARFIAEQLAPACPDVLFIIAGGVGEKVAGSVLEMPVNVMVTGHVDDERRDELLLAADLAINPMNAGSGTNIKMFDFMAAGLPVLTTEIGARGIGTAQSAPRGIFVKPLSEFSAYCAQLAATASADETLASSVREVVRRRFSSEQISATLGAFLTVSWSRFNNRQPAPLRVAIMSTWNIVCGIAEHTSYLADALETECGADVLLLGNDLRNHEPVGFEKDLTKPVVRLWHWDNTAWTDSHVDQEAVRRVLAHSRLDALIVQHHSGYLPFEDVRQVVALTVALGVPVVIEMHNGRDVPVEQKLALLSDGAALMTHHADELQGVLSQSDARRKIVVRPLPIRKPEVMVRQLPRHDAPVIGGFGFLRPYKGLLVLVEALALLRETYPRISYLGLHAAYPGDNSEGHLKECVALARKLGVEDGFHVDMHFLDADVIDRRLAEVDLLVMPYMPSSEGASAAVNQALKTGRPVVVSPSDIFKSVSGAVLTVPDHTPQAYAAAVTRILSSNAMADDLMRRAHTWIDSHSYTAAASTLLQIAGVRSSCEGHNVHHESSRQPLI